MPNISLDLKCAQQHIGQDNLTNILEANLKSYYDWAFLSSLGAWSNVEIPTSGVFGDVSRLRPVKDPNYSDGQVWEGFRKDWVWETGVNYTDISGNTVNPISGGTPTINGVATTGSYYINYPQGQVIFNTPISTSATVKNSFAYRYVQIYRADDAPWLKELQYDSFDIENPQFLRSESGAWSILSRHRVQLPAIVIEVVPRGGNKGWELGSESLEVMRDINYIIVAQNRNDRNNLTDILNFQSNRKIKLFNTNTLDYPLDYRGMLTGTKMYPQFIEDSPFGVCEMKNSYISNIEEPHSNLYIAAVRTTTEVIV